jgi:predicted nuclease of predicted toxin-antitoxin system
MRLLFDQNLSFRLCERLSDIFPGSVQARTVGLHTADDLQLWSYARARGFTIVSLDADFSDLSILRGAPPKVIWLRCGNRPTDHIEQLLRQHADAIGEFERNDQTCLEIY